MEPDADLGEMTWVTSVWVGKGEPYSGPPEKPAQTGDARIIADKSYVDVKAIKQLELVGGLPGVRMAVGMPDLHPGNRYARHQGVCLTATQFFANRFPVGCAIAAEGIYPALIGSDVGCGIALYALASPSKSFPNPVKLASLLKGLDDPWSGSVPQWLAHYAITRRSSFDEGSLGTVGSGNHFCEVSLY